MRPIEAGQNILKELAERGSISQSKYELFECQRKALDIVDELLSEGGAIVARLPTGYGKTLISAAAGLAAITEGIAHRVIHTYPATSIIEHAHDYSEVLKVFSRRLEEHMKKEWGNVGELIKVGELISARHTFRHESPMLTEPYVLTTLDTLVMHYLKTRFTHTYTWRGTYSEFSAGVIRNSLLVFDEAHMYPMMESRKLFASQESDKKKEKEVKLEHIAGRAFTIMSHIIGEHASRGGLAIILTATMPDQLLQSMKDYLESFGIKIKELTYEKGVDIHFEKQRRKDMLVIIKNIVTTFRNKPSDLAKHVADELCGDNNKWGRKILVVMNTVSAAVEVYNKIMNEKNKEKCKEYEVILIHGSFTAEDLKKKISLLHQLLSKEKPVIVVSTQVIEASVDEDFDSIITEVAPIDSLIQRLGRVQRRGSRGRGLAMILVPRKDDVTGDLVRPMPYDKRIVQATVRYLCRGSDWCEDSDTELANEFLFNAPNIMTEVYEDAGYVRLVHDYELVDMLNLVTVRTPEKAIEKFQRYFGNLVRGSGLAYKAVLINRSDLVTLLVTEALISSVGYQDPLSQIFMKKAHEVLSRAIEEKRIVKVKAWELERLVKKLAEYIDDKEQNERKACDNIFGEVESFIDDLVNIIPSIPAGGRQVSKMCGIYLVGIGPAYRKSVQTLVYDVSTEENLTKRIREIKRKLIIGYYLVIPEFLPIYNSEIGLVTRMEEVEDSE